MRLDDKLVLELLHLEPADLSTGRRFVKDPANRAQEEEEASNLTRAALEMRGILTPPRLASPVDSVQQPAEAITGRGWAHEEADPFCLGEARLGEGIATHTRREEATVPRPAVVWVEVAPLERDGFDVLQKFEGTVMSVTGDSFVARLLDKTNPGPDEEAEIPLAEVMPGDRELVKPGAVFYWVIGYRRAVHGQLSRSSVIRFQRVPSWSPADIKRAKQAAETYLSFLDLDRANNTP